MMTLAQIGGRKPIAVLVSTLVVVMLGVMSLSKLPIDLFPDLQSPTVMVSVQSSQRPAQQMETLYGERIEQLLFTVQGIKNIELIARRGVLTGRLTFDWQVDTDIALIDVNRALASIAANPDIDRINVSQYDIRQRPVLVLGMASKKGSAGTETIDPDIVGVDLATLRTMAKNQVARKWQEIEGVAEVRVGGGKQREVRVDLEPSRLRAFNLSVDDVRRAIQNANKDYNAGTLEDSSRVFLVQGKSRFVDRTDIENVILKYVTNERDETTVVRLDDIATVSSGFADTRHTVRVNGQPGIGLFIYKEAGANAVAVSANVMQALDNLKHTLPGVTLTVVADKAQAIDGAIDDVKFAAFMGALLAIAVMVLFLRGAGPVLVIAAAVPVSVLATLFVMKLAGFTLNLITLAGLALGIGLLVDNAIVVLESIYRARDKGLSLKVAIPKGTNVISGAIVTSTFTTCVVFLPVLFIQGTAAKLASEMGFTVVISLLSSLLVALLIIPALATFLLRGSYKQGFEPGYRTTQKVLAKLLQRPALVLLVTVMVVIGAGWGINRLGTELVPPADSRQFSLRIVTEQGLRVEMTENSVANVETIIAEAVYQDTHQGAGGENRLSLLSEVGKKEQDERQISSLYSDENTAELHVKLFDDGPTASEILARAMPAFSALHGVKVTTLTGSNPLSDLLGKTNRQLVVQVNADQLKALQRGAKTVKTALQNLPFVAQVVSSFDESLPGIQIHFNRALVDKLNIDTDVMLNEVASSLDGIVATHFYQGEQSTDVVIRQPSVALHQLEQLRVRGSAGQLFTLGDIATIEQKQDPRELFRKNQQRMTPLIVLLHDASELSVSLPQAREQVVNLLQQLQLDSALPLGVTVALSGNETERQQTLLELQWAFLLAVLLVFMILAASFESLWQPLVLLSAIPLALVGVAAVLLPLAQPVGLMAMLGIVVLIGISVNDAILLAKTIEQLRPREADMRRCIEEAVRMRFRPILMTTTTTVLSLLPLAIGLGDAVELRVPLALTVIGGVVASTLGSVFVIPCIYLVLHRFGYSPTAANASANASIQAPLQVD